MGLGKVSSQMCKIIGKGWEKTTNPIFPSTLCGTLPSRSQPTPPSIRLLGIIATDKSRTCNEFDWTFKDPAGLIIPEREPEREIGVLNAPESSVPWTAAVPARDKIKEKPNKIL